MSAIWFDIFQLQTWLKLKFGILPHEYRKPFDCFTCTNFWFGVILSTINFILILVFIGFDKVYLIDYITFFGLNYLIGNIIDHIKYV